MAKVKITKELDSRNTQYFKLTKKRGKITVREVFEAMEESYYFGEYLIQFNVPEEAPMDLYEDGDEWRLYAVKELLEEELYKAHQEGYEECKEDFNLENNGWIPVSERLPEEYEKLKQDEIILGFTLDNKCDLDTFVGNAKSCVYHGDEQAIHSLVTGEFTIDDVYVKGDWMYPEEHFMEQRVVLVKVRKDKR